MVKQQVFSNSYKYLVRPILFSFDPEKVHNAFASIAKFLSQGSFGKKLVKGSFGYSSSVLKQKIQNIEFMNPVGLAAGFDYDGHMAGIMCEVGFGFNTVGTVTALCYQGNTPPRLMRLVDSKSLLVNKGFKSDGAPAVLERLDALQSFDPQQVLGVSVGSSNLPTINSIDKAIQDYLTTFSLFKDREYVKYFELNVSCPNTSLTETFFEPKNYESLLNNISSLGIRQPIFVKMPSEESFESCDQLIQISLKKGINTFIFSNLAKKRDSSGISENDKKKILGLKGNLSGKPVFNLSNELIKAVYKKYGNSVVIVGCGGIFSAEDAYHKIKCGASLVQLITGMIYNGPQFIGELNYGLEHLLKKDGYSHVDEARGTLV